MRLSEKLLQESLEKNPNLSQKSIKDLKELHESTERFDEIAEKVAKILGIEYNPPYKK